MKEGITMAYEISGKESDKRVHWNWHWPLDLDSEGPSLAEINEAAEKEFPGIPLGDLAIEFGGQCGENFFNLTHKKSEEED